MPVQTSTVQITAPQKIFKIIIFRHFLFNQFIEQGSQISKNFQYFWPDVKIIFGIVAILKVMIWSVDPLSKNYNI